MNGFTTTVDIAFLVALITTVISLAISYRYRLLVATLKSSNARLSRAQKIGGIGDWEFNPATGALTWSDYLCEVYGRPAGAEISSLNDVGHYIDEVEVQKVQREIDAAISTGREQVYEICARLASGSKSVRRIIAVPQLDTSGRVISVLGTDQDVTLQNEHIKVLGRLNDIARISSINALAATLAHEIGQPLTTARNFLAILGHSASKWDGRDKHYVSEISSQLALISDLVKSAKDVVSDRLEIESVSFISILNDALLLMGGVDRWPQTKLQLPQLSEQLSVLISRSQTKHLLCNLLRNAVEAVPLDRTPSLIVAAVVRQNVLEVSIQDNGTGFNAGLEPFRALSTTKPSGMGLGLSLSKTIVDAQGGQIWIEETGYRGSDVRFTLALEDARAK